LRLAARIAVVAKSGIDNAVERHAALRVRRAGDTAGCHQGQCSFHRGLLRVLARSRCVTDCQFFGFFKVGERTLLAAITFDASYGSTRYAPVQARFRNFPQNEKHDLPPGPEKMTGSAWIPPREIFLIHA
jgi:hypothetical protein